MKLLHGNKSSNVYPHRNNQNALLTASVEIVNKRVLQFGALR